MVEVERPLRTPVAEFIHRHCPGAEVIPLAGDASTRRFHRIALPGGETRVVVDYGVAFDAETDDIRLNRVFRTAGLRVAEILAAGPEAGCLLVEDLGDRLLETAFVESGPAERRRLLEQAVTMAVQVRLSGTPALVDSDRAEGPALDADRFRFEMDFFLEHYVSKLRGRSSCTESLRPLLHALARQAAGTPSRVLCHRDFHSRNLLILADDTLALVDIQDARWGPDTYDLASLLRDAYVDVPEEWIDPLIRGYLEQVGDPSSYDGVRKRFDRVAAQRMIKALGSFGYLIATLGRRRYADAIPRTLGRLRFLLPADEMTSPLFDRLDSAGLLAEP